MKKQLAIAASVLLTLSTAVATTLNDGSAAKPAATIEVATQVVSKESAQAVLLVKAHASSSGSVPLARPL
ncbi:MAG TPA: hypothetical protein VH814_16580 [Steroidobacteraceae bacterium]|jgi:hypothetical protein